MVFPSYFGSGGAVASVALGAADKDTAATVGGEALRYQPGRVGRFLSLSVVCSRSRFCPRGPRPTTRVATAWAEPFPSANNAEGKEPARPTRLGAHHRRQARFYDAPGLHSRQSGQARPRPMAGRLAMVELPPVSQRRLVRAELVWPCQYQGSTIP